MGEDHGGTGLLPSDNPTNFEVDVISSFLIYQLKA